ncbi:hypothetical protein AVEN_175464-1 [Araneus ventricosus]|uniref:Uncharacterized protein n=1 Tax=Araneus ventricosus TaxID=182803 RepID=A0A4Y2RDY8_ARAVE|nr:hypothetical protein AVEN_175464-1 [Araneus ventricosus]
MFDDEEPAVLSREVSVEIVTQCSTFMAQLISSTELGTSSWDVSGFCDLAERLETWDLVLRHTGEHAGIYVGTESAHSHSDTGASGS